MQCDSDSCAPHANIRIKTECLTPDSNGAVAENWGEILVSNEFEHKSKIVPKSIDHCRPDEMQRAAVSHTRNR